jgi:hypothetical protein
MLEGDSLPQSGGQRFVPVAPVAHPFSQLAELVFPLPDCALCD